jgi:hypothetical protein
MINGIQREKEELDMFCIPILKQNVNTLYIPFCIKHLTKWQCTPALSPTKERGGEGEPVSALGDGRGS